MIGDASDSNVIAQAIARGGQIILLRGTLAILFGLVALFLPGVTLIALIALFCTYALLDGIIALVTAFRMAARHDPWVALLFQGILGIVVAIIGFRAPGLTALALLYVVAAWALLGGIMDIAIAIELRKQITGEWVMIASGALSILFGLLLTAFPIIGIASLVMIVGIYAIIDGIVMIALGVRLRSSVGQRRPDRAIPA